MSLIRVLAVKLCACAVSCMRACSQELANTVERAVLQQQQMAAAGGAAGKAAGGGTGEWSGRLSEEVFW